MSKSVRHRSSILLMSIVIVLFIAGCAEIRKLTYPQDFVYLEKSEVDSLMKDMSNHIERLNSLVIEVSDSDVEKQKTIIVELSSIERIATRLSGGHKQTNQLFISDHIQEFISDVGTAKMFASSNPPRYNKTRDIKDGCQTCHQQR